MSAIAVTARDESGRTVARLRLLATALAVAALAEAIAVVVLSAVGDAAFSVGLDLPTIGFLGSVVLFPVVGALIVQRRPYTRVAWLMIAIGLLLGFGLLAFAWGVVGIPPGRTLPGAFEALLLSELFFVPTVGAGAALLLLLFPTDRLLSPRWRSVAILSLTGAVLYEIGTLFHAGELNQDAVIGVPNPLAAPAAWAQLVGVLAAAGNAMVTAELEEVVGLVATAISVRSRP